MNWRLLPILFLLLATLSSPAAERIRLLITVTNVPVTGNTLTVNSDIRTWTNASTASTILTNLVSTNHATTNLFQQIASFPYAGGIFPEWVSSNSFRLVGSFGGALSGLQTGNWAALVLSTQAGPSTYTALWPMENIAMETNRTNQGSSLVYGLGIFSTNAFPTNSTAVSNLLQKGAGPLQYVRAPVLFNSIGGTNSGLTNGTILSPLIIGPTISNATIQGSLSVTTLVMHVEGSSAAFLSVRSVNSTDIIGPALSLLRQDGAGSAVSAGVNLGIIAFSGQGITGEWPAARIITLADETFDDTTAAGSVVIETTASGALSPVGRVRINSSGVFVTNNLTALGVLSAGSATNMVLRGVGTVNGRLDYTSRANAGLANGNNSGVILGTNVYVRLSGATTIAALAGFAAEQDGSFHILQFSGAVTNLFLNDSGVDATPANRIITGTGGDLAFTNSPTVIGVIYDATASRWRLMSDR